MTDAVSYSRTGAIQPQNFNIENINTCLSKDLIIKIFSFLDRKSLFKCLSVCKQWLALRPHLESLLVKKITCVVRGTLVDFNLNLFNGDEIISIAFQKNGLEFSIGHFSGSLSSWDSLFPDSAVMNYLHRISNHGEFKFLNYETEKRVLFVEKSMIVFYNTAREICEKEFYPKETPTNVVYSEKNNSIYFATEKGTFEGYHLDLNEYHFRYSLESQGVYIHSLLMGQASLTAVCNSLDKSSFMIHSLGLDGRLEKTWYKGEGTVSFSKLVRTPNDDISHLVGIKEPNILFLYNFDNNNKSITFFNLSSFFPESPENSSLKLSSPWPGYVFAYQVGNSKSNVVVLNTSSLRLVYQFNLSFEGDETLLSIDEGTEAEKEILVTSTKRVLLYKRTDSDLVETESNDKPRAKRQKLAG